MKKNKIITISLILALFFNLITPVQVVYATSSGPNYPTSATTQAVSPEDDTNWTNPGNIGADDGNDAVASNPVPGSVSYRLKGQGLGFSIASGATIDGILVEIERRSSGGATVDYRVQLLDASGNLVGSNKANTVEWWPGTMTIKSYGGATDKWDASPTLAMVNDPDFGVAVSARNTSSPDTFYIDFIRITVYYTLLPTNDSLTFTNPYQGSGNDATGDNATKWNFRAVVSDQGGYTNLTTVKLRLADSSDNTTPYQDLEFTWTEATDTFSETGTDALSAATITSTGTDSTCSGNTCTLDFKIQFNNNFDAKSTNYNAELYTTNDVSATDADSYASFYQVKSWYASGEQYWISETQDAGVGNTSQPNRLTASWTLDGSDNIAPKFQVLGSSTGAFAGEETIYPAGTGTYYQDGGTYDINNGVALDISSQVTTAYRYWKVKAYIDTGTDQTDTPSIQDIRLRDIKPLLLQSATNQPVGIGTVSPLNKLHVEGTEGGTAGIYLSSTVPGSTSYTLYNNAGNLYWNGNVVDTGGSSVSGTAGYIGKFTSSSAIGNSVIFESSGNVGIGTTGPGSALNIVRTASADDVLLLQDSSGTCEAQPTTTGLTWSCSSDTRLKTNITNPSLVLDYITNIPLKDYTVIKTGEHAMGPIAEEMQQLYPELVRMGDDGYLQVSELSPWQIVKGIQEQQLQIASLSGQLAAFNDLSLSNTGDLNITFDQNTQKYEVKDSSGNMITQFIAAARATIGTIRTGLIQTQELLAEKKIVSPLVETGVISPLPDSSDVAIQLGSNVASGSGFGKLLVQNSQGETVASIDEAGNATFSGQVTVDRLQVADDATVTGTLYAEEIITKKGTFGELLAATVSASQIAAADLTEIQNRLAKLEDERTQIEQISTDITDPLNSSPSAESVLLAESQSWEISDVSQDLKITSNLKVLGRTSLADTSIAGSLNVDGTLVIADSSINSLSGTLYLQNLGLGGVDILAGKVVITQSGDVSIQGNLAVGGEVSTSKLALNAKESEFGKLLEVKNPAGEIVASIDASGSAQFAQIETKKIVIANDQSPVASHQSPSIETNATAGTGVLKAGQTELTIKNSNITDKSLIYLTPVSGTQNKVLYVLAKKTGEFFKVAVDTPVEQDIVFNWWIIN